MFTLVLTGPYEGRTIELRSILFRDGKALIRGSLDAYEGVIKYMGRCYQAYVEGTEELRVAQETYARLKEKMAYEAKMKEAIANGEHQANTAAEPRTTDPVLGQVQPPGQGTGASEAQDGRGHDAADGGYPRIRADGTIQSGPETPEESGPGTPAAEEAQPEPTDWATVSAVLALDPNTDEHWTHDGKPAVAAVAAKSGMPEMSRARIETAVPDFDREVARETKPAETTGV